MGHSRDGHANCKRISIERTPPTTAIADAVMMYWMAMILWSVTKDVLSGETQLRVSMF